MILNVPLLLLFCWFLIRALLYSSCCLKFNLVSQEILPSLLWSYIISIGNSIFRSVELPQLPHCIYNQCRIQGIRWYSGNLIRHSVFYIPCRKAYPREKSHLYGFPHEGNGISSTAVFTCIFSSRSFHCQKWFKKITDYLSSWDTNRSDGGQFAIKSFMITGVEHYNYNINWSIDYFLRILLPWPKGEAEIGHRAGIITADVILQI